MLDIEQLRVLLFKEYLDNRKSLIITFMAVLLIPSLISYILLMQIPSDIEKIFKLNKPDGGDAPSSTKKILSAHSAFGLLRSELVCENMFDNHTVLYNPVNNQTSNLMQVVQQICPTVVPVASDDLQAMLNSLEASTIKLEYHRPMAGIIFRNLTMGKIKTLEYEIIPTSFAANIKLYEIKKLTPVSMISLYTSFSPYLTSAFAPLQTLVNEAYIKITDIKNDAEDINVNDSISNIVSHSVSGYFQFADVDLTKDMVFLIPRMVFDALFVSMLLPMLIFVKRILDEKNSQMKQFLRNMSMGEKEYWMAKFIVMAFLFAFIATFVTNLLLLHLKQRIAASLLFFIIYTYFICSLLFAMAFTTIFTQTITGLSAFLAVQLASTLPLWNHLQKPGLEDFTVFQGETRFPEWIHLILCVFATPNYSFILMWFLLLEGTFYSLASTIKPGVQQFSPHWFKLFNTPPYYDIISPGVILLSMFAGAILWSVILCFSLEIEQFQEKAETSIGDRFTKKRKSENSGSKSEQYFESEPKNLKPGIVITRLVKRFRDKTVVEDVDLTLYNGQITVLLGHNGAGKTTLMSMMTGMLSPTSGEIVINGTDITLNPTEAKRNVGLCPQKSFLYDHLTVEENLYIFGILKGFPRKDLIAEIDRVLELLKFEDKCNVNAGNLSGGMRRKLQIGIAIVGGCNVLVLDEPSSGLDIKARRDVWNFLMSIRKDFLIFMTTHHMEEADCLADRIIIMAGGGIQCSGTSQFLKRAFNVGYLLRVVTEMEEKSAVQSFVEKHLSEVKVERESSKEILFSLHSDQSPKLPSFFKEMENQRKTLGITSYGVNVTSLDDVFIQSFTLFRDKGKQWKSESVTNFVFQKTALSAGKTKFWAMFLKRLKTERKRWYLFLAFILLSFLGSLLSFSMLRAAAERVPYFTQPFSAAINAQSLGYNSSKGFCTGIADICQFYKSTAENTTNTTIAITDQDLWTESSKLANDDSEYENYIHSYMMGLDSEFKNSTIYYIIWYNLFAQNSLPISIDTLFNTLLRVQSGNLFPGETSQIKTSIRAFKEQEFIRTFNKVYQFVIDLYTMPWILLAGFVLAAAFPSVFATHENDTKTKLLQFMTGVSPLSYWCANFIFDFCYLILVFAPFWILAIIFNDYIFKWNSGYVIFLGFMGFVLSSISMCYLFSLFLEHSSVYCLMVICSAIPVTVLNLVIHMISLYEKSDALTSTSMIVLLLRLVCSFSPFWVFTEILVKTLKAINSYHVCNPLPYNIRRIFCTLDIPFFDVCCRYKCGEKCIAENYNPFSHPIDGAGKEVIWLYILFLVEMILVFVFESEICQKRLTLYSLKKPVKENNSVMLQRKHVEQLVASNKTDSEALVCHNLSKIYTKITPSNELELKHLFKPQKIVVNFAAVNHLSLAVHKNEVIGFLGVDGAGKTTTFRLIVGDVYPSKGNAFVSSFSMKDSLRLYQQQIGYCPQENALLQLLTGRETLEYFAALRGISKNKLKAVVAEIIHLTDLDDYADIESTVYSGGNKRKLALAIALVGSPLVILLDEPTAGVDPVARRRIWKALEKFKNVSQGSIMITTHSMDECEALCNTIAILANGKLQCLGSIQQIKTNFGFGFTVNIKLKNGGQNFTEADEAIKNIFPSAECIDNHIPLVAYQISGSEVTVASLFEAMEKLKVEHNLEEYQVSQTNLEQIFLAVQQSQK